MEFDVIEHNQESAASAPPSDEARLGRSAPIFTRTPEWVLASNVSPQAYTLYAALLAHVNRQRGDGVAWPGMDMLARIVGFRRRQSLRPYMAELEALGAVDIERHPRSTRRGYVYVVHEMPPEGFAGPMTVAEFEKQVRAELDTIPAPRGGAAPLGEGGTAPAATDGAASANQTNRTETKGSRRTTPPGENTSPVWRRSQAHDATRKPKRLTLIRPKRWMEMKPPAAAKAAVGTVVKAYERLGAGLTDEAKSVVGDWVRDNLARGMDRAECWRALACEAGKFGVAGDRYPDYLYPLYPALRSVN